MELTPHTRVAGDARRSLTSLVVERHRQGASLRTIAAELGRSYGFVHRLLDEAGVEPRHRGGDTRSPQARERRASSPGSQVAAEGHITSTPEGGATDMDAGTRTDPPERAAGQPTTKAKKKSGKNPDKRARRKAEASEKADVANGTSVSAKGAGERAKSQKTKVGKSRGETSKKAASKRAASEKAASEKVGNKKPGNKKASKRTLDKVTSDTSDKPGKSGRSGKAKKAKQS